MKTSKTLHCQNQMKNVRGDKFGAMLSERGSVLGDIHMIDIETFQVDLQTCKREYPPEWNQEGP